MRFERDASGRPLAVTDALGQKESWQYDGMGRITSKTDREGKTSTFTYTPGGKPGSASSPDGRNVLLSYDALGNLERVKDWLGELCFTRDGAGRITEAGNHRGETLRYEWNPDGTRRRLEYPDGLAATYCYDRTGRLSALTCGDFQLRFQYDGNGRLAECLRGNGVSTRYVYDRTGLPSLVTHARGNEILEQLSCRYDPLGNPVCVERKSAEAGCSCACEYAYDQNGRLSAVRVDGDPVRKYRYDGYGNRTGAAPGAPALPPCPYTPLDQPPGSSYTPNGGLSSTADGCGYRYDALGHLTTITRGGELLQGNEYDGLGHRVRTFGQLSGAFGGDIRYTIDDTGEFPHILLEQGGRERKYLWQENTLCGMPEEGRYVLTDPLGTPLVVAGPDGQVQNAYRYDEFGLSEYRREEAPLPFGFTGYLADRVEGLYYANAREYHAGSGRFLTKDLNHYMDFKDPGTLNLYQYAKGNPLKYVDPSGHESINEDYGYLFHTMNMAVGGSFTNDFTWAGLGIQLALGFFGVDIICDARDFAADVTVNRDLTSLSWWGMMALDIIAFAPAIGDVKYLDDAVYGVKMLFKNGDELVDGSRRILKAADSLEDLSRTGGNVLDGLNDMAGTALKNADMLDNARYADDVVDAAKGVQASFANNINDVLVKQGLTLDEFNSLRLRDISALSDEEKNTLRIIRESVPMPDTNTLMQKVIPTSDITKYMDGTYTQIGGYVTKAEDVAQLNTYDDLYDSLRLDYPGSAYQPATDESIGVIRYTTDEVSKISVPYGIEMGGTITDASPFTGNGFTKATNGEIIPEFKCDDYLDVADGAQLIEINRNGEEILKAVYSEIEGKFIPVE